MAAHEVSLAHIPGSHQGAAVRLSTPAVILTAGYRARLLAASRDKSDARIVAFSDALCKRLADQGMPFVAHCFHRSDAEQRKLRKEGRTKAGAGQSPHNHGYAVDVVHYGRWWDLDEKEWAVVGLVGKEVARKLGLKVTWGGDWKFYDPAHWELEEWRFFRSTGNFVPWPCPTWKDQHKAMSRDEDTGQSFSTAFRVARKLGVKKFTWRGSEYSTELK